MFSLIHAFGMSGDLRSLENSSSLSWDSSICLADCHDSKVGDSYKFGDDRYLHILKSSNKEGFYIGNVFFIG